MKVRVGVSNRHVHLCEKDFKILFENEDFHSIKDLSQKGEFASNLMVDVKTNKGTLHNVRVIGPLREVSQIEISKTDAYVLGINPPVRMSGNLDNSSLVTLVNGENEVNEVSCILAHRHIHANEDDIKKYGLDINKKYSLKVVGVRGGILDNVLVKVKDNYTLEVHIDTDEANAFNLNNGDYVEIMEGDNLNG